MEKCVQCFDARREPAVGMVFHYCINGEVICDKSWNVRFYLPDLRERFLSAHSAKDHEVEDHTRKGSLLGDFIFLPSHRISTIFLAEGRHEFIHLNINISFKDDNVLNNHGNSFGLKFKGFNLGEFQSQQPALFSLISAG